MMDNSNVKTREVGICIYCFSTTKLLNREHIIPFGLNGRWILLHASCVDCSKITSAFERHALRDILLGARSYYGLNSYHKKLPKTTQIKAVVDGHSKTLSYPVDKFGSFMCLLTYPLPAHIDKRKYSHGSTINGNILVNTINMDLNSLGKYLSTNSIQIESTFRGNDYERFIAKIAYGFAVLQYGIEAFDEIYVLPSIMGTKDDIGKWFGSSEIARSTADLEIALDIVDNEVHAHVRLFGLLPVPTYVIVVGRLKTHQVI